jgi:hypothetical protein
LVNDFTNLIDYHLALAVNWLLFIVCFDELKAIHYLRLLFKSLDFGREMVLILICLSLPRTKIVTVHHVFADEGCGNPF